MNVFDSRCQPVGLGKRIGHGGEASVLRVEGRSASLAKIYEPEPKPQYLSKLEWMQAHPPENPTQALSHPSLAWPSELLYDPKRRLAGYLMPFIRGAVPMLEVFNPRRRMETLPQFDRRYLHRVARNLAAAVGAVHSVGYVIGDINESNILVTPSALVTLIDTDSFQVEEKCNGRKMVHSCPVGKPEYTPPELQGQSLVKVERQPEHDSFGLAVLIFQLLMEGSHPFRAQWLGKGEPPPLETRIAKGYFPYTSFPGALVIPPANAPSINTLHPWISELFRRCFVDGYRKASLRPDPSQWETAIAEAESCLVTCDNGHIYSNHQRACPFCQPAASTVIPTIPSRPGRNAGVREEVKPNPAAVPISASPAPAARPTRPQPSSWGLFPFGWLFVPRGSTPSIARPIPNPVNPTPVPANNSTTNPTPVGPRVGVKPGGKPSQASPANRAAAGASVPGPAASTGAGGKPAQSVSNPFRSAPPNIRTNVRAGFKPSVPPPAARVAAPSTPFPGTWPRVSFSPRPIFTPPAGVWERVRTKVWKSALYGGGMAALLGGLSGAVLGASGMALSHLATWSLLWSVGGAAGGMLRGYQPSYRFGWWVNRNIGWRRFWKGAGIGLGVSLGFLTMLPWVFLVVPSILMMVLGGMVGSSAGQKIWLLGARVGWERIWAVTGTASTAFLGLGATWLMSHTGAGALSYSLANQLAAWLQSQSAGWTLIWAVVGALAGSLGGALAGFISDLFARFFGLVD